LDPGTGEQAAFVIPPGGPAAQPFAPLSHSRIEKTMRSAGGCAAGAAFVVVTVKYVKTPVLTASGVSVNWYGPASSTGHGVDGM